MRRALVLISALFFATSTGAIAGERLLVPQLDGWRQVVGHAGPTGEVTELIPDRETAETWTRRITVQAFRGAPVGVAEFLDNAAAGIAKDCLHPMAEPPRLGRLDGAEAGSRLVTCGRTRTEPKGAVSLFYAISGQAAFYVVSRMWRGAAFDTAPHPVPDAEMAEWIAFMRAIRFDGQRSP